MKYTYLIIAVVVVALLLLLIGEAGRNKLKLKIATLAGGKYDAPIASTQKPESGSSYVLDRETPAEALAHRLQKLQDIQAVDPVYVQANTGLVNTSVGYHSQAEIGQG